MDSRTSDSGRTKSLELAVAEIGAPGKPIAMLSYPISKQPKPTAKCNGPYCSTRRVWQPRLGRDLSREDGRQIAANVIGFFSVLAEWSTMPFPANDPGQPGASENGNARHDR
jgi:hypothetical protein